MPYGVQPENELSKNGMDCNQVSDKPQKPLLQLVLNIYKLYCGNDRFWVMIL